MLIIIVRLRACKHDIALHSFCYFAIAMITIKCALPAKTNFGFEFCSNFLRSDIYIINTIKYYLILHYISKLVNPTKIAYTFI